MHLRITEISENEYALVSKNDFNTSVDHFVLVAYKGEEMIFPIREDDSIDSGFIGIDKTKMVDLTILYWNEKVDVKVVPDINSPTKSQRGELFIKWRDLNIVIIDNHSLFKLFKYIYYQICRVSFGPELKHHCVHSYNYYYTKVKTHLVEKGYFSQYSASMFEFLTKELWKPKISDLCKCSEFANFHERFIEDPDPDAMKDAIMDHNYNNILMKLERERLKHIVAKNCRSLCWIDAYDNYKRTTTYEHVEPKTYEKAYKDVLIDLWTALHSTTDINNPSAEDIVNDIVKNKLYIYKKPVVEHVISRIITQS